MHWQRQRPQGKVCRFSEGAYSAYKSFFPPSPDGTKLSEQICSLLPILTATIAFRHGSLIQGFFLFPVRFTTLRIHAYPHKHISDAHRIASSVLRLCSTKFLSNTSLSRAGRHHILMCLSALLTFGNELSTEDAKWTKSLSSALACVYVKEIDPAMAFHFTARVSQLSIFQSLCLPLFTRYSLHHPPRPQNYLLSLFPPTLAPTIAIVTSSQL